MEVLVIDDEPLVAKTLSRLLRPHSVEIRTSAVSALETICERHYDLIFCDLMMPEVSGQQLYQQACEQKPELAEHFVFITGGTFSDDSEEFLSTSGLRVLYKPFDRVALKALLEATESRS